MKAAVLAVAAVGVLAFAGCGDSGDESTGQRKPTAEATTTDGAVRNAPAKTWTDENVTNAIGLTTDDGGISYTSPSGCDIAVLLHTAGEVETYAGAGDTVVTNPDGSAGVKITGATAACIEEAKKGLASLK